MRFASPTVLALTLHVISIVRKKFTLRTDLFSDQIIILSVPLLGPLKNLKKWSRHGFRAKNLGRSPLNVSRWVSECLFVLTECISPNSFYYWNSLFFFFQLATNIATVWTNLWPFYVEVRRQYTYCPGSARHTSLSVSTLFSKWQRCGAAACYPDERLCTVWRNKSCSQTCTAITFSRHHPEELYV